MAQSDITTTHPGPTLLDAFFAGLGQGFNAYPVRRSRIGEINRLNAMSDAELAAIGVARDRIPHHVFRDLFYI